MMDHQQQLLQKFLKNIKRKWCKSYFLCYRREHRKRRKKGWGFNKRSSFEYGNAIANHSYTHNYKYLYPGRTLNLDNFLADFNKTDELLKKILGPYFSTRVIRCPGGHMSWKGMDQLDNYLNENNMASIDWNALNADAEGRKKNAQELADYAIKTSQGKDIVVLLMHDTYGKEENS